MAADDDLTFDFEHQLEEEPEPLSALPVRAAAWQQTKTAAAEAAAGFGHQLLASPCVSGPARVLYVQLVFTSDV